MYAVNDLYLDADGIFRTSSAPLRRPYGPGPDRRVAVHHLTRAAPYSIPQPQVERRSVVPELGLENGEVSESGTKLYISNLDYGVSNADIKLLFSEEGELKRYSIHYDKSGRSKGTAEVVFMRHSDALAAMKKYHNMRLDGKPLHIELVGSSLVTPAVMPLPQNSLQGRLNVALVREQGNVGGNMLHYGFAHPYHPRSHGEEKGHFRKATSYRDHLDHGLEGYHRRPRGRTGFKGHMPKLSVKDLDEDLERYQLEAKKLKKKKGK